MTTRIKTTYAWAANPWRHSAFRMFTTNLLSILSWRVGLALALAFFYTLTQGVQLVLVVPLMQLVGINVQQGNIGGIAELVSSVFATLEVPPTLATVLLAFILLTGLQAIIGRWQAVFNLQLQQDFVAFLRRRLYDSIVRADWLTLARSRSSDFTHALTTELDRVGEAASAVLVMIASSAVLAVYVFVALWLSLEMTALVFFCGAGLLLLLRKKTREVRWSGEDISVATNGLYAASIEHLAGIKTTKGYGMEERSSALFSGLAREVAQMHLFATRVYATAGLWFQVGSILILTLILYTSVEVLALPTAELILLIFLFNRMIPLFSSIQGSIQRYLEDLPAFTRVMEMIERYEAVAEPRFESSKRVTLQQEIQFRDVSFAYAKEGESWAISGLELSIEAGKTTAITGPSGAGKSTLVDLVIGLILPSRGQILVDGVPLSPEHISAWRPQIGYVAQDTFLFNDTVRANLLFACPEATDEEINRALKSAAAEEFVSKLPEGLETVLGDRGVRLSGGERQRLALARALLRRPPLLILDEATSALDSENERRVQRAIEELHGQMTILIITHRLTAIRGADVIHVLEKGKLVESGSWSALVGRKNGRFEALCRAQGISSSDYNFTQVS